MARIRSIKPEFPQSETIGRLSRDARLLFIMLWTIVDDSGRARASSRMLASLLYPYDDDVPGLIDGWLGELEAEGCVRRYCVDGSQYLDIPNWLKHQKIDKPSASKLPEFDERSVKPREASRMLAPDLGPRTLDLGPRNGKEHNAPSQASGAARVEFELEPEPELDIPASLDRQKYPDEFEALWHEYRPIAPKNATKSDAFSAWKKLSAAERDLCWSGLVEYAVWVSAERKRRPDTPVKHLATFINKRGWETFMEQAQ